ncbi:MAG: hypothetical protein ACREN5_07825, partial [Gemmatimonadales bacterium]
PGVPVPRRAWFLVLLAVACSGGESSAGRDTLTQRQHDSILAQSSVPGAKAVGAAMKAADSASARARAADTSQP